MVDCCLDEFFHEKNQTISQIEEKVFELRNNISIIFNLIIKCNNKVAI